MKGYGGAIEVIDSGLVAQIQKPYLYILTPDIKHNTPESAITSSNYKSQKPTTFCTKEKEMSSLLLMVCVEYVDRFDNKI